MAYIVKRPVNVLHGAKATVWSLDGSAAKPVNVGSVCFHLRTKFDGSASVLTAALCDQSPYNLVMNEKFSCVNVCILHLLL